jgi:hypothetical protein
MRTRTSPKNGRSALAFSSVGRDKLVVRGRGDRHRSNHPRAQLLAVELVVTLHDPVELVERLDEPLKHDANHDWVIAQRERPPRFPTSVPPATARTGVLLTRSPSNHLGPRKMTAGTRAAAPAYIWSSSLVKDASSDLPQRALPATLQQPTPPGMPRNTPPAGTSSGPEAPTPVSGLRLRSLKGQGATSYPVGLLA